MPTAAPMTRTVPQEILEWSTARPDWQRDALRRIMQHESLQERDLEELTALCTDRYLPEFRNFQPSFLSAAHMPNAFNSSETVSLLSIGHLVNVNRLMGGEKISFQDAPGLTVIFGKNGAGKSGYARVLKHACVSRGSADPILPDAFLPSQQAEAEAEIGYRNGSGDQMITWKSTQEPDRFLTNIFVFDRKAGEHYLQHDGPVVFTPLGLDILMRLVDVCRAVKSRLEARVEPIQSRCEGRVSAWLPPPNTQAAKLLATLTAKTRKEEVERLAELQDAEKVRLRELKESLAADPAKKAMETRASATRVKRLMEKIKENFGSLKDESFVQYQTVWQTAKDSRVIAETLLTRHFDDSYLEGTGTESWRALMKSAYEFMGLHQVDDPKSVFEREGARCALCQRALDSEVLVRFTAFDNFLRDQSNKAAEEAASHLMSLNSSVKLLKGLAGELEVSVSDLTSMTPEEQVFVQNVVRLLDSRLELLRTNLAAEDWVQPAEVVTDPDNLLEIYANKLDARAVEEEGLSDLDKRSAAMAELAELEGRVWLLAHLDELKSQIDDLGMVSKLGQAVKDTDTSQITRKNTEIARSVITSTYAAAFKSEIGRLGLRSIDVELQPIAGEGARTNFGLRLLRIPGSGRANILTIASEGEQRCMALAAFFAELSLAGHNSALIFDDPVSSLDDQYRERVAQRLVEEAKLRQVVVLTHSIAFFADLDYRARKASVDVRPWMIEWSSGSPGRCLEGFPWALGKVGDRLTKLGTEANSLGLSWQAVPTEANERELASLYSRLRATLELLVEDVMFGGTVKRFERYVKTGNLKELKSLSRIELIELLRLVKECHDVTDAHEHGLQINRTPQDLSQLLVDAESLLRKVKALPTLLP